MLEFETWDMDTILEVLNTVGTFRASLKFRGVSLEIQIRDLSTAGGNLSLRLDKISKECISKEKRSKG